MNTKKHLNILSSLITLLFALSIIGLVASFIAMIGGEGPLPFAICVILFLSLYFSMVFINVIIDFYDVLVIQQKKLIVNANAYITNCQNDSCQ